MSDSPTSRAQEVVDALKNMPPHRDEWRLDGHAAESFVAAHTGWQSRYPDVLPLAEALVEVVRAAEEQSQAIHKNGKLDRCGAPLCKAITALSHLMEEK